MRMRHARHAHRLCVALPQVFVFTFTKNDFHSEPTCLVATSAHGSSRPAKQIPRFFFFFFLCVFSAATSHIHTSILPQQIGPKAKGSTSRLRQPLAEAQDENFLLMALEINTPAAEVQTPILPPGHGKQKRKLRIPKAKTNGSSPTPRKTDRTPKRKVAGWVKHTCY